MILASWTKIWLVSDEDLHHMYSKKKQGDEVSLWVDLDENSVQEETHARKRKHDESLCSSSRQDKEEAVDSIYADLCENHSEVYTKPQLRLWARMISTGIHESLDLPPDVPMITGKSSRESLSDSIAGAAMAFVNAMKPGVATDMDKSTSPGSNSVGISPGKTTQLCMQNLQQLRYLQQLYEDNILSSDE